MRVDSTHLFDVNYEDGVLKIEFHDGSIYDYSDVPVGIFQELMGASSKSAFFRANIKGKYEYTKVN